MKSKWYPPHIGISFDPFSTDTGHTRHAGSGTNRHHKHYFSDYRSPGDTGQHYRLRIFTERYTHCLVVGGAADHYRLGQWHRLP